MSTLRFGRRAFFGGRFAQHIASLDVESACDPLPQFPDELPAFRRRTGAIRASKGIERRARIEPFACLTAASQSCTTCIESCPVPGAITLSGIRPSIDTSLCDGCGLCEHTCPAPGGAIRVLPIFPNGGKR